MAFGRRLHYRAGCIWSISMESRLVYRLGSKVHRQRVYINIALITLCGRREGERARKNNEAYTMCSIAHLVPSSPTQVVQRFRRGSQPSRLLQITGCFAKMLRTRIARLLIIITTQCHPTLHAHRQAQHITVGRSYLRHSWILTY